MSIPSPSDHWFLTSSPTRDPFQPLDQVHLSRKAQIVALSIPVKGNEKYIGYDVVLKTADGQQGLWKDRWPKVPPPRIGSNIVFLRPAGLFTETSYKLPLTLMTKSETKTRDYYFTLVRQ